MTQQGLTRYKTNQPYYFLEKRLISTQQGLTRYETN